MPPVGSESMTILFHFFNLVPCDHHTPCLLYTSFQELAALGARCSIAAFERAADDAYMRYIRDHTKYIAYGAGVLCAFIAAKETEAKNFRILVASVRGKIPPAEIKERLRLSDV